MLLYVAESVTHAEVLTTQSVLGRLLGGLFVWFDINWLSTRTHLDELLYGV